ncbi:MAG TPA: nuclear transport factor 2 family protein [Gammaproteobacteria bacterium]|nr:nuclear transport factor 2 family protein [Gammaproteobacteria bacterium]
MEAKRLTEDEQGLIERACTRLVLESAAANDRQDFEEFAALFTQDGVLHRPAGEPLAGREAIVESYHARPANRVTRHLCTNILIYADSLETAHGLTYVILYSADASAASDKKFGLTSESRKLLGEFEDRFVLSGGVWRIAERRARFVMHT